MRNLQDLLRLFTPSADRDSKGRGAGATRASLLRGTAELRASSLQSFRTTTRSGHLALLDGLWTIGASGAEARSSGQGSGNGGGASSSSDLQLEFPCVLRPAVGPKGLDLQLQLFKLRIGDPAEPPPSSSRTTRGGSGGGVLLRVGGAAAGDAGQQQLPPLLSVLDRAACLLVARLLFPATAVPAIRLLAAAQCASAAAHATSLLLSPAARAAAHRRLLHLRQTAPLVEGVAQGAQQLGGLLQQYGEPAAVLLLVAALWAYVHPSSAQIGEAVAGGQERCRCCAVAWQCCYVSSLHCCMLPITLCPRFSQLPCPPLLPAALLPVLVGYNQTAKHCATLGLTGQASEEVGGVGGGA
jgi:hypothetical protein